MPDKHEVGGSSPLGPTSALFLAVLTVRRETEESINEYLLCEISFLIGGAEKTEFKKFSKVGVVDIEMFIENRIEKRNETDSCILRKTCY